MKLHTLFGLALLLLITPLSVSAACAAPSRELGIGSQGSDVGYLQEFLREKNYLKVATTNYYGTATAEAVKKFQVSQKIEPTGYVGPYTRARLRILSCEGVASGSTLPGITFTSPQQGDEFAVGEKVRTTWEGTTSGVDAISIHLVSNMLGQNKVVRTVARTQASKGSFNWRVPTRLTSYGGPGSGYALEMRGKAFSTRSEWFTITDDRATPPKITDTSAKASDSFEAYSGEALAIEGRGFLVAGRSPSVYFAGRKLTLTQSPDDDLLYVTVPRITPGTYSLYVTTSAGKSNTVRIRTISTLGTNASPPKIGVVVGDNDRDFEGISGGRLVIYGQNFSDGSEVYIGGAEARLQEDPESGYLIVTVPPLATGYHDLWVKTEVGESDSVRIWVDGKG